MSKVAITGNASGTGTFTIAAPNSDSDFTLTLPASSGTIATAETAGFESGTVMMFVQTAAPTGWTKSTTHNNKALRVVSGTASSGGSVAFTTAFASQSVSGSIGNTTAGGTVGDTTLSTAQMPSHTHNTPTLRRGGAGAPASNVHFVPASNQLDPDTFWTMTSTGSSSAHNHTFTGSAHNHTFTGTAVDLAVQYVDVIIATKD